MRVRDALVGDVDAVAEIYAGYVRDTTVTFAEVAPGVEEWVGRVGDPRMPFLVVEVEGAVVGMAYCSPWKAKAAYRYTVESSVYLSPGAVGRGMGRVLLGVLLERAAVVGVREVIAVIVDGGERGFGEQGFGEGA
ncbi:GNAT family N-acetyltransferase [Umezawaea sp. Da 62-37]|uniref:GNAT family N-acetyltransferase n=1 Tax=Umezawaea sp. Da 62-37 TaxID=3075927 RepID=UPI0028F71761|nr:GNAT family N-acetyltransferase [Umezawaea sp. Da 62-37]WNV84208.1 GNAT family N-acetyltransferase [Umezawaea sp. Da 62-37]